MPHVADMQGRLSYATVSVEPTDSDSSSSSSSGNTFLAVCQATNSRAITLPVLAASLWALARIDTDGEPLVIGRRGPVAIAFPATAGIGWSKVCGSASRVASLWSTS